MSVEQLPSDDKALETTLQELLNDDTSVEGEKPDDKVVLEINEANEPKKEEKKEKEEKEEEKEEVEEEEEEPLELDDDEVNLVVPVKRKEILAKFPDLFKTFPYIEKALYREQAFTEHFATPAQAEEAVQKVETFNAIEGELFNGSTAGVLDAVKKQDPEAFKSIVDNFITDIAKVDKEAANHIFGNIIKHTIVGMVQTAKKDNNEELDAAAKLLYQFYFGNAEWTPPTSLAGEKKDRTVEKEREEFQKERFESTFGDLSKKVDNLLRSTIDTAIDPKGLMTQYIKSKAVEDTIQNLHDALNNDKRFKAVLDGLWEAAFKANFNAESVNKIRKAYLSRAKSELVPLIRKNRNTALQGLGKRASEEKRTLKPERVEKREEPREQPQPKKRMSTFDLLNQD